MKALIVIVVITAAILGGVMTYTKTDMPVPVIFRDDEEVHERVDEVPVSAALVNIHDGVSVSPDMQVINLSNRSFSGSLKAEIRHVSSLRELDISNNQFTGVPAEVGQLSNLEVLDLSYNPITGLPHEIGNLKNLLKLDLRGTQYSKQDLEVIKKSLPAATIILVD